jgi:hypothetical protein
MKVKDLSTSLKDFPEDLDIYFKGSDYSDIYFKGSDYSEYAFEADVSCNRVSVNTFTDRVETIAEIKKRVIKNILSKKWPKQTFQCKYFEYSIDYVSKLNSFISEIHSNTSLSDTERLVKIQKHTKHLQIYIDFQEYLSLKDSQDEIEAGLKLERAKLKDVIIINIK